MSNIFGETSFSFFLCLQALTGGGIQGFACLEIIEKINVL